jgi:hypothetical protein
LKKILKWIGYILAAPFIIFIPLYIYTLIVQLWPEKIEATLQNACGVKLDSSYEIIERNHSYSNAIHGVWYSETGKLKVSPSFAEKALSKLNKNPEFTLKNGYFDKFTASKVHGNCSINQAKSEISYTLILW